MKLWTLQYKTANAFAGTFAFLPTLDSTQKKQKSLQATAQGQCKLGTTDLRPKRATSANSTYKKLAVQWLIEHSTSHQLLWYVDSLVLRNPLLRKAANRQNVKKLILNRLRMH